MKEHLRTAIWRDIIISLRKRRFNSADGDKEEKNMTVKECYEQMGSDYEGVLERLGSEAIVKRFALKFLQDPSFAQLKESLAKNDGEEAFRAAHTLKGVCLNLGFDELFEVSAELTEKLRERETAGSEELFQKVSEKYQKTVMAIQGLE
mgnify:CR=1 FL=1